MNHTSAKVALTLSLVFGPIEISRSMAMRTNAFVIAERSENLARLALPTCLRARSRCDRFPAAHALAYQ